MSNKTPSILIVDDEPDLREILEDRFQLFKFETKTAGSGNQAWGMIQGNKFDVVLSDIRMPDGTGLELLEKIKKQNANSPAVFLMTGFHKDFSVMDMLNLGADGFFAKPFDATQIRNTIQNSIVKPNLRWSTEGRYSATKSLHFKVQQIGKDFKVGRRGFSIAASAQDLKIGEICNFQVESSVQLKGLGKLVWHQTSNGHSLGIEILYLEPDSLTLYLSWLDANAPIATVPAF